MVVCPGAAAAADVNVDLLAVKVCPHELQNPAPWEMVAPQKVQASAPVPHHMPMADALSVSIGHPMANETLTRIVKTKTNDRNKRIIPTPCDGF